MSLKIDHISNFYFLGIGGIGMSALARYFNALGKHVAGYDLTPSAITDNLEKLGVAVHFEDDPKRIPEYFTDKKNTLVIRTPAIPAEHNELRYFTENDFYITKRAEVLGSLFNSRKGIAIAGTHGKTSVSSMTAHILHNSELKCSAFLGGILKNVQSNLILDKTSEWVVAEADEFDRSFLHLHPFIALVTWVDPDHLDIYGSPEKVVSAFTQFVNQVLPNGSIVLKKGIQLRVSNREVRLFDYSLDDIGSDYFAENIRIENNRYCFDIHTPEGNITEIRLLAPGITNIENAVAAAAVSHLAGVKLNEIAQALNTFAGVRRRFDLHVEDVNHVYIDDYAHHPRELDAIIGSLRNLYSGRKITGIFQPHLFSRTRDFAAEFAESLSQLDSLILLDIYPARELPVEGVDSDMIFRMVSLPEKIRCSKQDLLSVLEKQHIDVLVTMGAGDIDRYAEPIKKLVQSL